MVDTTLRAGRCLALLWLCVVASASWAWGQSDPAVVPGELLVGLQPGAVASQVTGAFLPVGREVEYQPRTDVYRLSLRSDVTIEQAIARLRRLPIVRFAEPNRRVRTCAVPNDPYFRLSQYGPVQVQADRAWEIWRPQAPVVVAVVDSGIDTNHPDLRDKILRDGLGVVGYDSFTGRRASADDDYWHGTHCAGIIGAGVNNGVGIAGIAGWDGTAGSSDTPFVRLMPVKVLSRTGYGDDWRVGDGIVWAVDHGARVISLSLVLDSANATVEQAVRYAWDRGCVVVAAAGNLGGDAKSYPAAYDGVISVAATDGSDRLASFSSSGDWVLTAAPGVNILSTTPTRRYSAPAASYSEASGTSMACPHVAGEAALLLSEFPGLTNRQVLSLIVSSVDPYTPNGDRLLAPGAGRVNLYSALQAAERLVSGLPAEVAEVSAKPSVVTGGSTAVGTVLLTDPAPTAGFEVTLTSDATVAAVPASVVVPMGAKSVTFPITTQAVREPIRVTIAARHGDVERAFALDVAPDPTSPISLTLTSGSVTGGEPSTGRVTLGAPAPSGGAVVDLTSASSIVTVPARVTVPAGATSATFQATTPAVVATTSITLRATRSAVSQEAVLTVLAAVPDTLTFRPSLIRVGASTTVTLTLTGPAPAEGLAVTLASSHPALTLMPGTVTVPAGASSATFTLTAAVIAMGTAGYIPVTLSATSGETTSSATLRVRVFR